jgi:hypothetical protein
MKNNKEKACKDKPALHHIPPRVLFELAKALKEGNDKYGYFNYRKAGAKYSTYYSSTWRHLGTWFEGTDIDKDSGLHHVLKSIAGLVVLYDSILEGNDVDDRPDTL